MKKMLRVLGLVLWLLAGAFAAMAQVDGFAPINNPPIQPMPDLPPVAPPQLAPMPPIPEPPPTNFSAAQEEVDFSKASPPPESHFVNQSTSPAGAPVQSAYVREEAGGRAPQLNTTSTPAPNPLPPAVFGRSSTPLEIQPLQTRQVPPVFGQSSTPLPSPQTPPIFGQSSTPVINPLPHPNFGVSSSPISVTPYLNPQIPYVFGKSSTPIGSPPPQAQFGKSSTPTPAPTITHSFGVPSTPQSGQSSTPHGPSATQQNSR